MKKSFLLLLCSVALATGLQAQRLTHLWTGLKTPQPAAGLPKGNAPYQATVRLPKVQVLPQVVTIKQGEQALREGWELTDGATVLNAGKSVFDPQLNTAEWYNATVPGTVLTTLVQQNVYADPYFGLNNLYIPDTLSRMDWWYRQRFVLTDADNEQQMHLVFEGINYFAEVFLNGRKLGNIKGAFIRGEFDVSEVVYRDGKENVLAVHVYPPANPGIPHEQSIVAGAGAGAAGAAGEIAPAHIAEAINYRSLDRDSWGR